MRQPTLGERIEAAIEGWEPALILVAILALIFAGFTFRGFGKFEAAAAGFGFPLAALLVVGSQLRGHSRTLVVIGAITCLIAFLAGEEQVSEVLLPSEPIAHSLLHDNESLTVDDAPTQLRIDVHGDILGSSGDARYSLEIARGEAVQRVHGTITHEVRRTRKGTQTSLHLTERHEVTIAGTGPIKITLDGADDQLRLPVVVDVRAAPFGSPARWLLIVCVGIGAIIEAVSTREGQRVRLTPAIGMVAAFSEFVAKSYNPDSPLKFMIAALLFALIAGGLGGWLVSVIATWLSGKRRPASPAHPASTESTDDAASES